MARAREAGVCKILVPSIDLSNVYTVLDVCGRYPRYAYPMIGLHPEEVNAGWEDVLDAMHRTLLSLPGEFCGNRRGGAGLLLEPRVRKRTACRFRAAGAVVCRNPAAPYDSLPQGTERNGAHPAQVQGTTARRRVPLLHRERKRGRRTSLSITSCSE